MEKQIKQLIELSRKYYDFGITYNLKDCEHNYLRGYIGNLKHLQTYKFTVDSVDDFEIRIYFSSNRQTRAINFGKIDISEYSDKISLPFNVTTEYLQDVYDNALDFLHNHLLIQPLPAELEIFQSRQDEIKELEEKLKALKETV